MFNELTPSPTSPPHTHTRTKRHFPVIITHCQVPNNNEACILLTKYLLMYNICHAVCLFFIIIFFFFTQRWLKTEIVCNQLLAGEEQDQTLNVETQSGQRFILWELNVLDSVCCCWLWSSCTPDKPLLSLSPSRTPQCLAPYVLFSACLILETKYPQGRFNLLFFFKWPIYAMLQQRISKRSGCRMWDVPLTAF